MVEAPTEEEVQLELGRGVSATVMSDDFSDFTITCQGQEIKCNRLVISAMLEVIKTALTTDMEEKKKNELEIPDATPDSVRGMLNFMYTGKVPANISDIVTDLLHLADKYQLCSLKKTCEKCLLDDLTVDNTVGAIILVDRYKCSTQVRTNILDFFKENAAKIINTKDWTTALEESGKHVEQFTELFVTVIKK